MDDLTTASKEGIQHELRVALSRKSFLHFLMFFFYILEPPPARGKIKFEMWPHIMEVVHALTTQTRIVWLKSRQTGASWIIAALFLWQAQYFRGSHLLMFSQGQDECVELLWKSKYIW